MAPNSDLSAEEAAVLNPLRDKNVQAVSLDPISLRVYFALLMLLEHLVGQHKWLRWDLLPTEMMNTALHTVLPSASEHDRVVRSMEQLNLISSAPVQAQWVNGPVPFRRLFPANVADLPTDPDTELLESIRGDVAHFLTSDSLRHLRQMSIHPNIEPPDPQFKTDHFRGELLGEAVEGQAAELWLTFDTLCRTRKALQEKGSDCGVHAEVLEVLLGEGVRARIESLSRVIYMVTHDDQMICWPRAFGSVNGTSGAYANPVTTERIIEALVNDGRYNDHFPNKTIQPDSLPTGEAIKQSSSKRVKLFAWLRYAYRILIKAGDTQGLTLKSVKALAKKVGVKPRQLTDTLSRWDERVIRRVTVGGVERIAVLPGATVTGRSPTARVNSGQIFAILKRSPVYGEKVLAYQPKHQADRRESDKAAKAEKKASEGSSKSPSQATAEAEPPSTTTSSLAGLFVFDAFRRACAMLESAGVPNGVPGMFFLLVLRHLEPKAARSDFQRNWAKSGVAQKDSYLDRITYLVHPEASIEGPEGDWSPLSDGLIQEALLSWGPFENLDFSDYSAEAGSSKSPAPSKDQGKVKEETAARAVVHPKQRRWIKTFAVADAMLEEKNHTKGVPNVILQHFHGLLKVKVIFPNMMTNLRNTQNVPVIHSPIAKGWQKYTGVTILDRKGSKGKPDTSEPLSREQILEGFKLVPEIAMLFEEEIAELGKSPSPEGEPKADAPAPTPEAAKGTEVPFYRAEALTGRSVMATAVRALKLLKAVDWTHGLPGSIWTNLLHAVDPSTKEENQRCEYHHSAKRKGCMVNKRIPGSHEYGWTHVPGTTLATKDAEPLSDAEILELLRGCKPLKDLDFAALEVKKPAGSSKSPAPTPAPEPKADAPAPTPEASAPTPAPVGEDAVDAYIQDQVRTYLDAAGIGDPDAVKDLSGPICDEVIKLVARRAHQEVEAKKAEIEERRKAERRAELEAEKEALEAEMRAKMAELEAKIAELS